MDIVEALAPLDIACITAHFGRGRTDLLFCSSMTEAGGERMMLVSRMLPWEATLGSAAVPVVPGIIIIVAAEGGGGESSKDMLRRI